MSREIERATAKRPNRQTTNVSPTRRTFRTLWRRLRWSSRSRRLSFFAFLLIVRFLLRLAPFSLGGPCRFLGLLAGWRLRWFPGRSWLLRFRFGLPTLQLALPCVAHSACCFGPRRRSGGFQFAGAAYLVYLGVRKLLERGTPDETEPRRAPLRRVFARGAVVNVLNPKTALFFLAFLPQFVDTDRGAVWSQVVTLGLVFVALGLVSDSLYALAGDAVGSLLRRRARAMRRISGTIYVGLGAVAAFARR